MIDTITDSITDMIPPILKAEVVELYRILEPELRRVTSARAAILLGLVTAYRLACDTPHQAYARLSLDAALLSRRAELPAVYQALRGEPLVVDGKIPDIIGALRITQQDIPTLARVDLGLAQSIADHIVVSEPAEPTAATKN